AEDARYLRQLLERLDESKRVIVILTELEGMTSKEIAALLGLKQGTVDSRLRSARQELLRMVERDQTRWGGDR
ncbi:MAG TPA: sigma-70 family RNA polymerase sigma factor, partial [Polyangiaceae bacterium]|nr:sigma-70 family RNA polymerase sigma factor [Polyangiaceae bacterium]